MPSDNPYGLQKPLRAPYSEIEGPQVPMPQKPPEGASAGFLAASRAIQEAVARFQELHKHRKPEKVTLAGDKLEVYGHGALCLRPIDPELAPTIRKLLGLTSWPLDYTHDSGVIINRSCKTLWEHYKETYKT